MAVSLTQFAGVPFRVLRLGQGSAVINSWQQESVYAEEHIPGANDSDLFLLGLGPKMVTWRIETPTLDDYRALETLQQTAGVLRVPTGTSTELATEVDYFGDIYDEIADVTLLSVSNPVIYRGRNGPRVQADAQFRRAAS